MHKVLLGKRMYHFRRYMYHFRRYTAKRGTLASDAAISVGTP